MDNDFVYAPSFNRSLRPSCVIDARNTCLANLSGRHYPGLRKRNDLAQDSRNVVFQLQLEKKLRCGWHRHKTEITM